MTEHQERPEAAGAVEEILDVFDRVVRCADAAIARGRIGFDELSRRLSVPDRFRQRHEARRAEVVREILQPVCAVIDRRLAGIGEVHDAEHTPAPPVRLVVTGLLGLLDYHLPGVLERRVAPRH